MILLLQFFLAHLLGDFFLQNDKMVANKELLKWRSPYLYVHVFIHFILILLVTWNYSYWKAALIIMGSHLLIDGVKLQYQKPGNQRTWFFIDQIIHLVVLFFVWSFYEKVTLDYAAIVTPRTLIITTAILFVLKPASLLTKIAISKWTPDTTAHPGPHTIVIESLKDAGEWIGFLERLMILIFILLGKWEGVGFLLAAKSVFRFGDLKEPKETKLTEYVVIGTFLSFFIAILTGIITNQLLSIL
ncbi:DUF3307 domain-containing protein [Chitinophaga tropicalis]|uniref:DUF3307 domain-containing protein n=1 Tax=Chitinophaga tropicalis TaxID=2683588 RepID=A0A7K1UDB6_9BACT|nr:DUF3307 domain-containing protein [Chitinophaga tropicalis]MVT12015.1 DUF3307 domain-containing protein [Chitinophaga tropicalis]